jgi:effector-binding domain-containing protein
MTTYRAGGPAIIERAAQPYVGIVRRVRMNEIAAVADSMDAVFGWLAERQVQPAGAPFFKYNVIDMERELEVEAGVPVVTAVEGAGEIVGGVLPVGRYATVRHVGHPDELVDVTRDLLVWAAERGLAWDRADGPDGQRWGCRLEIYETDPDDEPDMAKWETVLAFRLAD